ncbi:MAG: hypothetical protein VZR28_11470 [Candidatus Cryptobacteroides sp.]|nr:hypothetical protein [Candidatus Cryptobacteroides sp.]
MSNLLLLLTVSVTLAIVAIIVGRRQKKPRRIMQEGKLLKSEIAFRDGEKLYLEKVAFKDWHVCIHAYYLISDKLAEGHAIVDQRWSYEDFCNITVRLEDCTYALIRQVDVVALVRSFRPMPIDEFDRIAQPLIM